MMDGSRLSRLIANHSRGNALAFNRGGGHQVCGSSGIEDPSANAVNHLFTIGPDWRKRNQNHVIQNT